ncbi:MAG TPA: ABC transporter substrate-binding protein [Burkholderiaceae bacterium]
MRHHLRLAALLALAGASAAAPAAGIVTYCADAGPPNFDAAQTRTIYTEAAVGLPLYDRLIGIKPGSTELVPGLAQRWEWSADGRVLTLHLRPGVKFHTTPWFTPTREMDADDVVWSLQRELDKSHPGHAISPGGYAYWDGAALSTRIRTIARVDPMTVRIELAKPDAAFLAELSVSQVGTVYSAEYAARLQAQGRIAQMATQPVGTGPFVLRSYRKDAVIRYAANPSYWGGAPKVDGLVFAITPDPAVRAQRVRAGECAFAHIPWNLAGTVSSDPRLEVVQARALGLSYVLPNAARPGLGDRRLREALSLAIDRAALIKAIYGGHAEPAGSYLPPAMWSHDAGLSIPHDPDKARALARASGYDGHPLTMLAFANDGVVRHAVEMLQADWARAGITVVPRFLEANEFFVRVREGRQDLAFLAWYSDDGDPDNFLSPQFACNGAKAPGLEGHWCSPAFDQLLAQGRATADPKARAAIYVRAQQLLADEAAVAPVTYASSVWVGAKRLAGVVVTPFAAPDFRAATLD